MFRESRGGGGEKKRERLGEKHWSVTSYMCPDGVQTHNLQPFGARDGAPTIQATLPGQHVVVS